MLAAMGLLDGERITVVNLMTLNGAEWEDVNIMR